MLSAKQQVVQILVTENRLSIKRACTALNRPRNRRDPLLGSLTGKLRLIVLLDLGGDIEVALEFLDS